MIELTPGLLSRHRKMKGLQPAVVVGKPPPDQVQHLEMTRDIATKFNLAFVPKWDAKDPDGAKNGVPGILKLPRAMVQESSAVVPGIDGQKMSKSYGNAIDLFDEDTPTQKRIRHL